MADHQCRETTERSGDCTETVLRGGSDHESVEAMTTRVFELLGDLPFSGQERYHLDMALHEAIANAAEHGNGGDPAKQVTITCRSAPRELTVIVEDEGPGFNPASVGDPTSQENLLKESGRGVFLMRRLTDECRFENRGRRCILVKRLP